MDPISKIGQMGAGQIPSPVKREPEKLPALEGTETEDTKTKQQEAEEQHQQRSALSENLKTEVDSLLKENITRYREAGLLDNEEMKNIMSIIVPGSTIPDLAKERRDAAIEESRTPMGDDDSHLNQLA